MDILEIIGIQIPCKSCGEPYEVSLKKIALSQEIMHDGCPVRSETECPPLFYYRMVDSELVHDLQSVWARLEREAGAVAGEVKLHCS